MHWPLSACRGSRAPHCCSISLTYAALFQGLNHGYWMHLPGQGEINSQDLNQDITQKNKISHWTGTTSPWSSFLALLLRGTLSTWQAVGVWRLVLFETAMKKCQNSEIRIRSNHMFFPSMSSSPFHSTFLSLSEGLLIATSSQDPKRAGWGRGLPSTLAKVQLW